MNQKIIHQLTTQFRQHFNEEPDLLVFSPGRINLIGEHTDYNEGFVLPAAVELGIYLVMGTSTGEACQVIASDLDEQQLFHVDEVSPLRDGGWRNYVLGVVHFLKRSGVNLTPFKAVFAGDIPSGAGMSSSAALENAFSFGLNELFRGGKPKVDLAFVGQQAEHEFVGVKCGIMDQFSSLLGEADHAMLLDCRSLNFRNIPLALGSCRLLLINSNVHHNLANSEYNVRREQVEAGVYTIREKHGEVKSLRDVTRERLEDFQAKLPATIFKRCRYVIEENRRVLAFTERLETGNLAAAGALLKESQEGMRNEYEITCPEIDFLADFANSFEGVLGARMMGGGFGGCVLVLAESTSVSKLKKEISTAYKRKFDQDTSFIEFQIADGTATHSL